MTKIDKRHTYGIILDTETANGLEDSLYYDIGWSVIDSYGNSYKSQAFINADVFLGMKDLMKSAYYADKIPQYWEMIKNGTRILTSMYKIREALLNDIKTYNVKFICAHNARFDYNSLNKTQRYITKSKYRFVLPYGLEWYDTMKMAKEVILTMPTYQKFCIDNNYMTNHKIPRPRLTAEILYKFISKNNDFAEEHMGLEDVKIETEIFKYCRNTRRIALNNSKLWAD